MKNIGFVVVMLVLVILISAAFAPVAAEDKFKFEVGPNFVGHRTTFHYPDDSSNGITGTSFSGTGLHGSGSVKLSGLISIGARFDHIILSDPTFFEITKKSKRYQPNIGEQRGSSQRAEGFVGFKVRRVGTLEAGVARHSFGRHWIYTTCVSGVPCNSPEEINSYNDAVSWGPVIGLTRGIELGSFTLGGGIWGYPRMNQNQRSSNDQGGTWRDRSETASGIKLEATGSYRLSERTAVKAGYQFFRISNPDPFSNSSWRIDTIRAEHAIIARYSVHF